MSLRGGQPGLIMVILLVFSCLLIVAETKQIYELIIFFYGTVGKRVNISPTTPEASRVRCRF